MKIISLCHQPSGGSISNAFGFEPIYINSSLVSAQHRQRLYWVGKRNNDGTYSKVDIQLPEDRGILLQDVLDSAFNHNKTSVVEPVNLVDGDKSFAIKANYYKSAFANFVNGGGHYPSTGVVEQVEPMQERTGINLTINGKAQCLRSTCYKDGIRNLIANNVDRKTGVAEPVRIGTWPNNAKNQKHDSQQYRIYDVAAKSVTLCGNGGGMGAKTGLYAIPMEYHENIPIKAISSSDGKTYTVYKVENNVITIKDKQYPIKLNDGYYIVRKLTVNECKCLQTVPDWYEFPVSDTQAYKMLGNGWTVSVIAHLLNSIKTTQQC